MVEECCARMRWFSGERLQRSFSKPKTDAAAVREFSTVVLAFQRVFGIPRIHTKFATTWSRKLFTLASSRSKIALGCGVRGNRGWRAGEVLARATRERGNSLIRQHG